MLRAFFGRHKSASTWARNIIHEAAAVLDLKITTVHVEEQWAGYPTLGDMVRDQKPDILIMTRPFRKDIETLPPMKAVHLIRDPRDIIVSGYFSHRNSHPEVFGGVAWPELIAHRKRLLELDKEAGLAEEIEFSHLFLEPMASWDYNDPSILEVRMEEMITEPEQMWVKLFTQLEMLGTDGLGKMAAVKWNVAARRQKPWPAHHLRKVLPAIPLRALPPAYLPDVLDRYSFTRLSGSKRKPGEVDENSHYRKGVARDWENHLTSQHLHLIEQRYGNLIERLGY
jgi:hypothetical protein